MSLTTSRLGTTSDEQCNDARYHERPRPQQKEENVSIFPTKILLAIDGSETGTHATDVAVELCEKTGSELHLLYVGEDTYSATLVYPEATDPEWVRREDPVLIAQLQQQFEQMSRRVLDTEAEKVREAGGTIA